MHPQAVLDTSGAALQAGIRAGPFAIKPNRAEAEELLGRPIGPGTVELARAALEILATHPVTWVLLSDGGDGLVVGGPSGIHHGLVELTDALTAGIVNDQGCGDSVVAAFVVAAAGGGPELSDPNRLVRSLLVAPTANLYTERPGELSAKHLALFKAGEIAVAVNTVDV